jgi:hypothetical protein
MEVKMSVVNSKDRNRLRELAKQNLEIAKSEKMLKTIDLWKLHNACRGERPMIYVELDTFADEVIPPLLMCEGEEARELERQLLMQSVNHTMFGDDAVVRDFFGVRTDIYFKAFDIDVKIDHATNSLGHHFVSVISDLEDDFEKLKPSTFGIDKASTQKKIDFTSDIIGDVLPVRLSGFSLSAVPTQNIVHIMSMEDLYVSLIDYPDLFEKMINQLADDYVAFYSLMSREGILLPTTGSEGVGQGTYCFTDELPGDVPPDGMLKPSDLWGFADSQETVGISETMFKDHIFPAYKKITGQYGLLSYGCCEPVHTIWDSCLSTLPNMRKISISPWCDEDFMGERLAGTKIIYHRKPSANYLGVGDKLDEDGLRAHIRKTLDCAKGCTIEFTQRDVYTINHDIPKVKKYVDIIREEINR